MEACNQCGKNFKKIGQHWQRSSCDYPDLSNDQKQICTGLLMGDGSIHRGTKNPFIQICMITPEYLNYIDSKFGYISTGVSKENRTTSTGNEIFRLNTRCLPEINEFLSWYSSGEKIWPENINLTPTVLKHWYCGDGNFDNSGSAKRIRIALSNESENKEKILDMFKESGFTVNSWIRSERSLGGERCSVCFTVEESDRLWQYMGNPLPGFEYKWPKEYRKQ